VYWIPNHSPDSSWAWAVRGRLANRRWPVFKFKFCYIYPFMLHLKGEDFQFGFEHQNLPSDWESEVEWLKRKKSGRKRQLEPCRRRCRSRRSSLKPPQIQLIYVFRGSFFILSSLPSFSHAFRALNISFRLIVHSSVIFYLVVVLASSLLAFSTPFLYVSLLDFHYINMRGLWRTHSSCWNDGSFLAELHRKITPARLLFSFFFFVLCLNNTKSLAAPCRSMNKQNYRGLMCRWIETEFKVFLCMRYVNEMTERESDHMLFLCLYVTLVRSLRFVMIILWKYNHHSKPNTKPALKTKKSSAAFRRTPWAHV